MKYLVTGATGLLGNNVVRRLLEIGEQVRVLSRSSEDERPFAGLDVERRTGNVINAADVLEAVQGMDVVIHSAGHVHIGWSQEKQHRLVNVEGARNAAVAARAVGARLVHISSVNALGLGRLDNPATEETALPGAILCPYVVTKRAGAEAVQKEIERGLSAVILNPGFMLGPWDWKPSSGKMLLEVARFAPLAPTGAYSVADARDVAAAVVQAAKSPAIQGKYVLAGHNLTYFDAWKKFAGAAGKRGPSFRAVPSTAGSERSRVIFGAESPARNRISTRPECSCPASNIAFPVPRQKRNSVIASARWRKRLRMPGTGSWSMGT